MTIKFKINQSFNESVIAPLIPISFDNSIEYNYGEFSQNNLRESFVKKQGKK